MNATAELTEARHQLVEKEEAYDAIRKSSQCKITHKLTSIKLTRIDARSLIGMNRPWSHDMFDTACLPDPSIYEFMFDISDHHHYSRIITT